MCHPDVLGFPLPGIHCLCALFEQSGLRKGVLAQTDLAKLPNRFCDSMIITGMNHILKGLFSKFSLFVDMYVSFGGLYLVHFFQFPF